MDKSKTTIEPSKDTLHVQENTRLQCELAKNNKAIARVNKEIREALEHEAQAKRTLEEAIEAAILAVEDAPSEGVTITSKSPVCGTIRLSAIRDNDFILAPEFYMQKSQAVLVRGKLKGAKTVSDALKWLSEMVETGRVRTSSGIQQLNKTTIGVLKQFLTD